MEESNRSRAARVTSPSFAKSTVLRKRGLRRAATRTALIVTVWSLIWTAVQTICAGSTLDGSEDKGWLPHRVLLLTAHPDDEVMFFAPVILALVGLGVNVSALCLSQGNADGLGYLRRLELNRSFEVLGVPMENVVSLEDPKLQDGMEERWDPQHVASIVRHHMEGRDIDTVITFDRVGISSHPNHIACFHAVHHRFSGVKVYALASVPVYYKFFGSAHAVVRHVWKRVVTSSRVDGPPPTLSFLSTPSEYRRSLAAMRMHHSQLVWFRYLYLVASTYMHGATLELVDGQ